MATEITENLIPFIEVNYKVSSNPADLAFCGLSAGGTGTYALLQLVPEAFE